MSATARKTLREKGRAARRIVPRTSMANWSPAPDRRDPVDILVEQGAKRVADLLPLRYARMVQTPFTFYRGAAAVMAADLGSQPDTGLRCQLAGDAHLANFGAYASAERDFVFDLNDFDETLPGPFEWDLKRLVASFAVAGRSRGFPAERRRPFLLAVVRAYREAMQSFAKQTRLDVWYARLDVASMAKAFGDQAGPTAKDRFAKIVSKAQRKTSQRGFAEMTHEEDGHPRFVSNPPLLVPADELLKSGELSAMQAMIRSALDGYGRTLQSDRAVLYQEYDMVDLARKVVGVGSVGTRCWVALHLAGDDSDPLILQIKEAMPSVLEPYAGASTAQSHGKRVVEGQRLMQASSDIFLGWTRVPVGMDQQPHDYYVRQMWDWKGSADLEAMDEGTFPIYAEMCGWTLARAHARSGDRISLAAYLGTSDTLDRALADYAEAYADQNEADHAKLREAVDSGRLPVMVDPKAK